jgi:hypothetical protein
MATTSDFGFSSFLFSSIGSNMKESHSRNPNNNENQPSEEAKNNPQLNSAIQQPLNENTKSHKYKYTSSISDFVNQKLSGNNSEHFQQNIHNPPLPMKCYQYDSNADTNVLIKEISDLKYQINELNKAKTIAEEYIKDLEKQNNRLATLAEKAETIEQIKRDNVQLREDNLRYREMLEEAFCLMNKIEQLKNNANQYNRTILEMQNYINDKNEYSQLISDYILFIDSLTNSHINIPNKNNSSQLYQGNNDTVSYREKMDQKRSLLIEIENKRKHDDEKEIEDIKKGKRTPNGKNKKVKKLFKNITKLNKSVGEFRSLIPTPQVVIDPLSAELSQIDNKYNEIIYQSPQNNLQMGLSGSNQGNTLSSFFKSN